MKQWTIMLLSVLTIFCEARHLHEKREKYQSEDATESEDNNILDRIVKGNRETDANYFEGDIDVANSFETGVDFSNTGDIDGKEVEEAIRKRNAQRHRAYLWPMKTIPYQITPDLYNARYLIKDAMKEFEKKTCLRFVPYSGQRNFIRYVKKNGCFSSVGRTYWMPGPQDVSLGRGCLYMGTVIHELMHAIGFWHEQSRPDRNKYVEIMWENIDPGNQYNFNKYSHDNTDSLVEYDFGSVMHYGPFAFSTNGKKTIKTIGATEKIGQRQTFSPKDIQEINILYDCSNTKAYGWSSWASWGSCDDSCFKKRQRFCPDKNTANCPGANVNRIGTETKKCSQTECYAPVNGHWGRWESWGACSTSCDDGVQTRTRKCNDPPPKNGGKFCTGSKIDSTRCRVKACTSGPYDCEFENNMCHWKNVKTDNADWHRITGVTTTGGTGPDEDHSSGSGYYVYFEASSPTKNNGKAQLQSSIMSGSAQRCLTFWYHMYGSGMGYLRVFKNTGGVLSQLFEKKGDQGNKWISEEITYDGRNPHTIIFEAQRLTSYRSDIGLDDVFFREHKCGQLTTPPSQGGSGTLSCNSALGMESGAIVDSQITATSMYDANHAPHFGRLNNMRVWCVSNQLKNSKFQHIQIKFNKPHKITAITTQGQPSWNNWVTKYIIKYSLDGMMYSKYNEDNQVKIFAGNKDRYGLVKHVFNQPIKARYLRVSPQAFFGNDACMRLELYGCPAA